MFGFLCYKYCVSKTNQIYLLAKVVVSTKTKWPWLKCSCSPYLDWGVIEVYWRKWVQGLSEPDFYGDLVYKLKKIVGSNNFSAQFIKIISHYKKIGYNINVLQQTACLVVNPITVGNFAFLFNCTPVGRTSDSMMVLT